MVLVFVDFDLKYVFDNIWFKIRYSITKIGKHDIAEIINIIMIFPLEEVTWVKLFLRF